MKLLLFSDLHLDRAFGWLDKLAARKLRNSLRQTLLATLDLAVSESVDAVLCGGDLYEHDRFTPDTANFVRDAFERLAPIPLYIAPGNHDWYGPGSLYAGIEWSSNVHIFKTNSLQAIDLDNNVRLWGSAHTSPSDTVRFLDGFKAEGNAINLALFHGSEMNWLFAEDDQKVPHAPFEETSIRESGLAHAFLGHYHTSKLADFHTYPGNPHPLTFGETGKRGPVLISVESDGSLTRETRVLPGTAFHDVQLDVTGCSSGQDIRDAFQKKIRLLNGVARVSVSGTLSEEIDFRLEDLEELADSLDGCLVRADDLNFAYNLDAICQEPSVRGQFVQDVQNSDIPDEEKRRVIVTGLRALDGRTDLEVY